MNIHGKSEIENSKNIFQNPIEIIETAIEKNYNPHLFREKIVKDAQAIINFTQSRVCKNVEREIIGNSGQKITVTVPENWSDNAVKIIASKYMRQAGVPDRTIPVIENGVIEAFARSLPAEGAQFGAETSVCQVMHRLAGAWVYWMCRTKTLDGNSLIQDENIGKLIYQALYNALITQVFAPNSPQWFNTGLYWSYGIKGKASGHHVINPETSNIEISSSDYERPQAHACFIQGIEDTLVNPGGIMDLWMREARIFKYGSGSGANYSHLRAKGEKLSGGGVSSGLMSFLKTGDASAGSIASGGTTRRAARMIVVDIDHPEIPSYVKWKSEEERKVAALISGSNLNNRHAKLIEEAHTEDGNIAAEKTAEAGAKAIKDGVPRGFVNQIIESLDQGLKLPLETYDIDWQGEAYKTVNGQNANNTIRVDDKFMNAVINNKQHDFISRNKSEVMSSVSAQSLWHDINYNAWQCADPGLHFKDEIQKWHTCKNDGEIRGSNPCSEYLFLDDTGCNLASAKLTAFMNEDGSLNVSFLESMSRIMTLVLETTVTMAQYPSEQIARGTRNYRTLGMGFMDLGALLMRLGIPYDSDQGRQLSAAIQSLMQSAAADQSASLAGVLGPFTRYKYNAEHVQNVMKMHTEAHQTLSNQNIDQSYNKTKTLEDSMFNLLIAASKIWEEALKNINIYGMRNAQLSAIAPTGTISLLTDCDTSGLEPDFALIKTKSLAGGGYMSIANQSIEPALKALGYGHNNIKEILDYLIKNNQIENCPALLPEHIAVFDTAVVNFGGKRFIAPEGHVKMMAALQPFVSGAQSKTVNIPGSATVLDIAKIHELAWRTGVKAIAIYRDGSKYSAPLMSALIEKAFGDETETVIEAISKQDIQKLAEALAKTMVDDAVKAQAIRLEQEMVQNQTIRKKLPNQRKGHTQKGNIRGEHKFFLSTGEYADGTLGEIFISMGKEGSAFKTLMNSFAIAISIGLQHGVPLEDYVDAYIFTRFEPAGMVLDHDRIKNATSILDLVFRHLALEYLGRDDLAHVGNRNNDLTDIHSSEEGKMPEAIESEEEVLKLFNNSHSEPAISKVLKISKIDKPFEEMTMAEKQAFGRSKGFTGDVCSKCQSTSVIRAGKCANCMECGESIGGCV